MTVTKVWSKDELIAEAKKFSENSYDENGGVESDRLAEEFRGKFPIERIRTLKSNEYFKKDSKDTLLYWLREKTWKVAGMWLILKEDFDADIQKSLVDLYELVKKDALKDYKDNPKIDLQVILKICYLLNPENFLGILSGSQLKKVLAELGLTDKLSLNPLEQNRAIHDHFRSIDFFKDWSTYKIKSFVYTKFASVQKPEQKSIVEEDLLPPEVSVETAQIPNKNDTDKR